MSHHDVLQTLSSSALFLSFGHPEGFGLPVAEALACGTAVIGYSGLGGRELFNIGKCFGVCWDVNSVITMVLFLLSTSSIGF